MNQDYTLHIYTGGLVETNGYLLAFTDGTNILIDAPEGVSSWLQKKNLQPTHLLLTHQHYDHVMDVAALQALGVPVYAHSPYSTFLTLETMARAWGMPQVAPYQIDHLLAEQSELVMGETHFALAHVPGHSPDSVTFYHQASGTLFSGDTLFQQSIGRADIPGHGDPRLLITGIRQKLLTLPPETTVYPGHGSSTTIQAEIQRNPYLR